MRSGWLKILIRLVVALGFLAVAVAVTAGLWWQGFVTSALKPPQAQVLEIKPGSSFGQAAQQLEKLGVVSDARALTLLARWRGDAGKIHAGEYQFEAAATPAEVLRRLSSGDVRRSQVTIPEGFNLKEIAARLEQAGTGDASEFLALMRDPALLRQQAIDSDSLEGYLFPETYSFNAATTPEALLQMMLSELDTRLTPQLLTQAQQHNLNRHQFLTLASIVQKEAGNDEEMPLIAAVFHNRLRRGIPLQADPTVIYDAANYSGNLTRKHLQTPTPYNTYRKRGLPPGPIASPGLAALEATAAPAQVKYLYFVARGDGSHEFSATLKEHNRAVRRYQLRR